MLEVMGRKRKCERLAVGTWRGEWERMGRIDRKKREADGAVK
jgi:hypothetical protein